MGSTVVLYLRGNSPAGPCTQLPVRSVPCQQSSTRGVRVIYRLTGRRRSPASASRNGSSLQTAKPVTDDRIMTLTPRVWYIAAKRSTVKAITDAKLRKLTTEIEHAKASIRAAVEHPFRVVKRQFGHVKARYRGLAKSGAQMLTLFALSNVWMVRKHLLSQAG
jgi:Transposase DDE domain